MLLYISNKNEHDHNLERDTKSKMEVKEQMQKTLKFQKLP